MSRTFNNQRAPREHDPNVTLKPRGGALTRVILLLVGALCVVGAALAVYIYAGVDTHATAPVAQKPAQAERRLDPPPRSEDSTQAFGNLPSEIVASDQSIPTGAVETASATAAAAAIAPSPAIQEAAGQRNEAALPELPASVVERPQVAPGLVASLRKRAEEAMSRADINAARLLLQRASMGGDADTLEDLARTYDPAVLERMGLRNIFPGDQQIATKLYAEAQRARLSAQSASPRPENTLR